MTPALVLLTFSVNQVKASTTDQLQNKNILCLNSSIIQNVSESGASLVSTTTSRPSLCGPVNRA
jgi:hypothetical protein